MPTTVIARTTSDLKHAWLTFIHKSTVAGIVLATILFASGFASPAFAQGAGVTIYGVTTSGRLVRFDSANPCTVSTPLKIEGLQPNEQVLGIDFRPSTGLLYALGSSSRVYTVNLATAVATPVGATAFTPALEGTAFGFDFNPVVDLIRIVSNTGQNLRVSPASGAVVGVDVPLAYAAGDPNAGVLPTVAGAAYTNPDTNPATPTTLYDVDVDLDVLATQNPANSGALQTRATHGVRTNELLGFDIAVMNGLNVGYAALKVGGGGRRECGNSTLVQIDLTTGGVTLLDGIGTQQPITGLAVYIPPPTM